MPAGRVMVSALLPAVQPPNAASVLAAWIASRSEQSPSELSSSLVVFTVIAVALAGPPPVCASATAPTATRATAIPTRLLGALPLS